MGGGRNKCKDFSFCEPRVSDLSLGKSAASKSSYKGAVTKGHITNLPRAPAKWVEFRRRETGSASG